MRIEIDILFSMAKEGLQEYRSQNLILLAYSSSDFTEKVSSHGYIVFHSTDCTIALTSNPWKAKFHGICDV